MSIGVKTTVLLISGMRTNGCREAVAKSLEQVHGVRHVHVNLYRAQGTIIHEPTCTVPNLIQAVIRVGYAAAAETKVKTT